MHKCQGFCFYKQSGVPNRLSGDNVNEKACCTYMHAVE